MELVLDPDVKMVAEFMQSRIAASKLVGTADGIAQLARLLWSGYPQEPCRVGELTEPKTGLENQLPLSAI